MPGFLFYYRRSVCRGEHLTRLPYFPKKRKVADNQHIINHLPRAENGTRTRDLNLGKVALYQLSYFRKMLSATPFEAFCECKDKPKFLFCKIFPQKNRRPPDSAFVQNRSNAQAVRQLLKFDTRIQFSIVPILPLHAPHDAPLADALPDLRTLLGRIAVTEIGYQVISAGGIG